MNDDDTCAVCRKTQFTSPLQRPELFVKCAVCKKTGKVVQIDGLIVKSLLIVILFQLFVCSPSQLHRNVHDDGQAGAPVFVALCRL